MGQSTHDNEKEKEKEKEKVVAKVLAPGEAPVPYTIPVTEGQATAKIELSEECMTNEVMHQVVDQIITSDIKKELNFIRTYRKEILKTCRAMYNAEKNEKLPSAKVLADFGIITSCFGLLGRYRLPDKEDVEYFNQLVAETEMVDQEADREMKKIFIPNVLTNAFHGCTETFISYNWDDIRPNFFATFLAIRSLKVIVANLKSKGFEVQRATDVKNGLEVIKLVWSETALTLLEKEKEKEEETKENKHREELNPGPHAITGV